VNFVAATEPAVDVRDLAKTFRTGWLRRRAQAALRGVSFTVPHGVIFGILGPNGAGKTTLLSILATLLTPDRGHARVLGLDIRRDAHRLRERINLSSGSASFLWSLTPREILDVAARSYGILGRPRRMRVTALLEQYELAPHAAVPYNELSTGLKQRLALAKAFVNDPELVILDEPTVGLDPDISIRIRAQIAALRRARRTTILLSTHYMREAEELCDDLVFLREGRILAHGDPSSLKRRTLLGDRVILAVDGDAADAAKSLADAPGVLASSVEGSRLEVVVDDARRRVPELLRHLDQRDAAVIDLTVHEPTLESVFIELAR
jgi:ABC-2 type transport system ATP-binding protein